MTTRLGVMTADAMRLAATQYNDATGFVSIMQENNLSDYRVNEPIVTHTLAPANAGATMLLIPPSPNLLIGSQVWCNGIGTSSVVINVIQNLAVSASPFCTCSGAVLPPQGETLTTTVMIAPGLDVKLMLGSEVTFTVGFLTEIDLPDSLPSKSNGKPT